jgi:hypothetical protein
LAITVAGIPVWPGGKTLEQIVAPIKNVVDELVAYNTAQLEEAAKQSKLAQEALTKQVEAESNAKLATAQADKLRELIIV